ncbi:uncharacterized protein N7479_000911 [Penicillium vulpinum]|uniref:uncharacterized protein n=1 Tax=Penicillium vulpinum TaxID=29845 RepID=UPI002547E13F|nr:uncharacterized protein N7479_000911 [Penicillium vulpinum]KAJ5970993.1 hypothetical protein N7479_000911 [Penicillium vulpinum]
MWIAFPISRFIALSRGELEAKMRYFHETYGEVVRFGLNEVSFITAQAWKDIYGHGHRQLLKVLHSTSNPADIVSANDTDHSRLRKSLAPAFSAKGTIITKYVDLLLEKLKVFAASSAPEVDMVKWYNLTTFDILGDLAFGEPFGGLESSEYHYWVSTIFQAIQGMSLVQFKDAYPLPFRILSFFVGSNRLMNARQRQIEFSRATVQKRLQIKGHRECTDFIGSMLRQRGESDKAITEEELEANSNVLVIAGSETTATLLSGVTYWLLRTPHAMEKITREIRSVIKTEHDLTISSTANLPYLLACLKEALRMYPPAPSGQQRITLGPEPTRISGYIMPPNSINMLHIAHP